MGGTKRTTVASRTAVVIGQARDIDGMLWDVREERETVHGFPLYIGWPVGARGYGFGGPRVIPTPELVEFLRSNRMRRDGFSYELPVARTVVKRLKSLLGLNYYIENEAWWLERLQDLTDMPGVRFAAVHGVSQEMVSIMHSRLIGRRTREKGWYLEESNAELLSSDLPRAYIADRLGIPIGAVGRLRWVLRNQKKLAR